MSTLPMRVGAFGQPNTETGVLMQDVSAQRRLAEQLKKQGLEQQQGQMVSNHYIAPSWTQQLAKVLQATTGGYLEQDAANKEGEFNKSKAKRFGEILSSNKPQQVQDGMTQPMMTPERTFDQFGSPTQGQDLTAVPNGAPVPNMTQESPEAMQQRQQAAILDYMQQYGNTPEAQYMLAQLGKQDDRAYARGEKVDDRNYADTREEKLYNRGRTDKLSDIDAERKYQDIVRADTQGFQVSQQDRQFANQYKMQSQSQGFQANQNALNRDFQANQNNLSRENTANIAQNKNKNKGLSVTAQKELFDAEDGIQGSKEAIKAFDKALTLNDKAMGGFGAGALATAGTILPGKFRPNTVDATKELDNVLQGSALPQLKAIFGGMPTEGERAILLEVQGSSAQPAEVRKGIFERAKKAADNRIQYNMQKAKQLRSGTYFTEEGGINIEDTPETGGGGGLPSQDAIAAEIARRRGNK